MPKQGSQTSYVTFDEPPTIEQLDKAIDSANSGVYVFQSRLRPQLVAIQLWEERLTLMGRRADKAELNRIANLTLEKLPGHRHRGLLPPDILTYGCLVWKEGS